MDSWKKGRKLINVFCKNCDIEYEKTLSEYIRSKKHNRKHFCSLKCSKEYRKSKPKYCIVCGEEISPNNKKFCSKSCSAKYNNKNRKGEKRNLSDVGLYNLRISAKINLKNDIYYNMKIYNIKPKKCKQCNKIIPYNKKRNIFCDINCRKEYGRINMSQYQKYYQDCKFDFSLNKYPNEFDFTLIEKYGWYSPINKNNNIDGVSRDHIYSIKEGYDNNISPEIIKHPANCQLLKHSNNISKNKKSDIIINDLKNKIMYWDKKYNI
jgi:Uncharacterized protein containing a Zn-ribbon (DUF2116)